jgi:hypothetical protein
VSEIWTAFVGDGDEVADLADFVAVRDNTTTKRYLAFMGV